MEADLAETTQSKSDRDALNSWVSETCPAALAYAISLVHDVGTAEDLVHDCYGRLLEKADQYDLLQDGRPLLFKAITNACINWTRRKSPVVGLDRVAPPATRRDSAPEHALMYRELEEAIGVALAELEVQQRAVVELQALGHSLVEVAEMLELSQSNTRVLLHRARKQLARRLQPFLEENPK
ncbi:MAG: RNA polymerase sigma factor [Planctomycetaceae bacterium]|nr:RNA polymerase sigma factor [Planctomycetaceae bacterium]